MKSLGVAVDYNPQTGYYQAVLKDKLRALTVFSKLLIPEPNF
jgi:hypothetical protein